MPPLTIMMKPASSLCNLRCSYCFYADVAASRETESYGLMEEATLQNLMRRAFAYAEGQLNFAFQGGEPTLAGKAFFRRFLELERRFQRPGLSVSHAIQTNGYALDEEWCQIFREGRFLVGVSLDGTREMHDACRRTPAGEPTFERIERNLRLLEAHGVEYNILCVVTQQVASHPEEVFRALEKHAFLQFIPCLDGFDGKQTASSLQSETYGRFLVTLFDLYERAFYAGKPVSIRTFDNWISMLLGMPPENCAMSGRCGNYYLVEADGSVYPCDFYVLDAWRMGNINEASFFRLEKSPVGKQFREESVPLPQQCRECGWLALCRGGCKRDREPVVDGVPSMNRLCGAHKAFFEARFDRMRKLALEVRSRRQAGQ